MMCTWREVQSHVKDEVFRSRVTVQEREARDWLAYENTPPSYYYILVF